MGSAGDAEVMEKAAATLAELGIGYEIQVASAHRTPERVIEYARTARSRGLQVVICGAGMAAHLAGAVSSWTDLPVLGVPLAGGLGDGLDALLSTVQMPAGVPVATFAVGRAGAVNAALFAARVLALEDEEIRRRLEGYHRTLTAVTETPKDAPPK